MKTALHYFPLLLLLACTPSAPATETARPAPAAEPVETWKREALAELQAQPPKPDAACNSEADCANAAHWDRIRDLLDTPDPPAVVGPEVKILPAGDAAIAWPAPKEGRGAARPSSTLAPSGSTRSPASATCSQTACSTGAISCGNGSSAAPASAEARPCVAELRAM